MRITSEQELNARIKAGPLGGLWLLTGSEEFLKKKYARLLVDKAVEKPARAFDAVELSARDLDLSDFSEDIGIFPCMGSIRSVTVTELDAEKILKDDWAALLPLLADIPPTTQLIMISVESADTRKSAKWKKLMELAGSLGVLVELIPRSRSELVKFVHACLKPFNAEIDPATAGHLIQLCDSDMSIIENECAKLGGYAAGGKVTLRDIDDMVAVSLEASAFDMVKLLIHGNYAAAFKKLSVLLEINTEPIMIVAAIGTVYSDLYKAAVSIEAGMSLADAVKTFGYTGSDYRMKNAWNEALRLSSASIGAALQLISDADLKLKSSSVPSDVILVTLLTSLSKGRNI